MLGGKPGAKTLRTAGGAPTRAKTLLQRDKASLDLFWLKDASMTDRDNLPEPDVLAAEIEENLRSALSNFEAVCGN